MFCYYSDICSYVILPFLNNDDIIQLRLTNKNNRKYFYHTILDDHMIKLWNRSNIAKKFFDIDGTKALFNQKILLFLKHNKKITHIKFTMTELNDEQLLHISGLPKLKSLVLNQQHKITDFGLNAVLQRPLEKLALCMVTKITDDAFTDINNSKLKKFRSSYLGDSVTEITVQRILASPKLETCKLYGFYNPIKLSNGFIPKCKNLKKLLIAEVPENTDNLLKQIALNCPLFSSLTIREYEGDDMQMQTTRTGLEYIFHENHAVKHLSIMDDGTCGIPQDVQDFVVNLNSQSNNICIETDNPELIIRMTIEKIKIFKGMHLSQQDYINQISNLRDKNQQMLKKCDVDEHRDAYRYKKYIIKQFETDLDIKNIFYDEDDTEFNDD